MLRITLLLLLANIYPSVRRWRSRITLLRLLQRLLGVLELIILRVLVVTGLLRLGRFVVAVDDRQPRVILPGYLRQGENWGEQQENWNEVS